MCDSSMHRSDPKSEIQNNIQMTFHMADEGNDSDMEDTDNDNIPKFRENSFKEKTYEIGSFIKWLLQFRTEIREALQKDLEGDSFQPYNKAWGLRRGQRMDREEAKYSSQQCRKDTDQKDL
ncbi:hypothetical protein Tco_0262519 [Tanacetum coccineum]